MPSPFPPVPAPRGRGRPSGSDSVETRAAILRAAREVINERGYGAATFQAIASRAGFSRPTMHYYFRTKEEIYESLQREAYAIVAQCIAAAKQEATLLKQLAGFVVATRRLDSADRSMMRFVITAGFEQHQNPGPCASGAPVPDAVVQFYAWMVDDAIRRGELPADVDAPAVVGMLFAVFWGMGFCAGFVHRTERVSDIAKQLNRLFRNGLLTTTQEAREAPV